MKQRIIVIIVAILATPEANADPPTRTVDSGQQAIRDQEKLSILLKELDEQRGQIAQLNQKKALALKSDSKPELAEAENRLIEVNDNISQLKQEINLAQGQPASIQPAVLPRNLNTSNDTARPIQTGTTTQNTGQWWDFYRRKNNQTNQLTQ